MCGKSYARHGMRFGSRGSWGHHGHRHGHFFGFDAEKMGPQAQVVLALAVLVPVALSGVVLAFTPVWWIFTTYFWVAFPAFGLLARGIAGLGEAGPARRTAAEDRERELLLALRKHGELTPVGVAAETSLPVAEADRRLKELADGGHLDVRVRGGGIFYALWESGEDEVRELERAQ
ncbi:hypothetical protein BH18ACT10_BH18ACT10_09950 [soil metagenome]